MVKIFILICSFSSLTYSGLSNQELTDQFDEVAKSLEEERPLNKADKDLEKIELDDLESIKSDLAEGQKELLKKEKHQRPEVVNESTESELRKPIKISEFDTGEEEKELLELAKKIGHKISEDEWDEIAQTTSRGSYKIVANDTLWSISKTLFGTGFFYSKIWSLNPYITNPHQIEPGMMLAFSLGSEESSPEIRFGSFSIDSERASDISPVAEITGGKVGNDWEDILPRMAEGSMPSWFRERKKLIDEGYYVESVSPFTLQDLKNLNSLSLIKEYKNYEPPPSDFKQIVPKTVDQLGFDTSSIIRKKVASGFYINTFLASNIVQDLGEIHAAQSDSGNLGIHDIIYVKFDSQANVSKGDQFSVYAAEGTVEHKSSERKGHRYTIKGHILVNKKKDDLWECKVTYIAESIYRHDRITLFTPTVSKILTTFNERNIEAVIVGSYNRERSLFSYGDVVYIDRGRADGVELGNIFVLYSFKDRYSQKKITPNPTYEIGELTVIILTDNFSTALVTRSNHEIIPGQLAITKTLEQVLEDRSLKDIRQMEEKDLEELDVELNLDHLENELKKKADHIELSKDELEELERIEREKSFLDEHERDRKELNRLEQEIEESEGLLYEAVEDQNKQLEQQDLDNLEKDLEPPDPNAFESLDEIEEEVGKKYLDQNLNEKDNPYGLTEFDLEEVDELLNTTPKKEGEESIEKGENLQ